MMVVGGKPMTMRPPPTEAQVQAERRRKDQAGFIDLTWRVGVRGGR
jgi:hypothetical protein